MRPKKTAPATQQGAPAGLQALALPTSVYAQHLALHVSQLAGAATSTGRQQPKRELTDSQMRILNGLGAVPGQHLFMKGTSGQVNALKMRGEAYQAELRSVTGDATARPVPGKSLRAETPRDWSLLAWEPNVRRNSWSIARSKKVSITVDIVEM